MKRHRIFSLILGLTALVCSSCSLFNSSKKSEEKAVDFVLSKTELEIGEKCIISSVKVSPSNLENSKVNFTVDDPTIATISGYVITALKPGTTLITGTLDVDKNVSKSIEINVVGEEIIYVTNIELTLSKTTIDVGSETSAAVKIAPLNANNINYHFVANPASKVSISGTKIKGLTEGTVKIKAVADDEAGVESNVVTLTINKVQPQSITLNPIKLGLAVGEEVDLNAVVNPSNAYDKSLSYRTKSGTNNVVSVSSTGRVKAITDGEEYVIAYLTNFPSITAEVKFVVSPVEPTSVSASVSKLQLYLDEEVQISTIVYPTNASFKNVSFAVESGNNNVIKVSNEGVVTGMGQGTDTVIVYCTYKTTVFKKLTFTVLGYTNPLDPSGDDIFEGA